METASRLSEDEDEFGRSQGSSQKVELNVKVDGKGSGQKPGTPTTPRSKHSATEQRRRCKINDRFQILRDLIPHSDHKRDKASLLLEVIEYIKFLQEKVQKYESYQGWCPENAKLMPWSNSQAPTDGVSDSSHVFKNGPAPPGFMFPGKFVDNTIPIAPTMLSNAQNVAEPDMNPGTGAVFVPLQPNFCASVGTEYGLTQPQERLISDSDNMASQSQSWQRPSGPSDCNIGSDMLSEQEELAIDEGTINISCVYTQGILTTLTQALESSGIDLSQASISAHINLGKRAISRRPTATTTMSSAKDHEDPSAVNQVIGDSRVGSSCEESEQALKRHKVDNS
ncbi:transcription factor BIM2-like isoform X1 [Phoenix dactylifera]|uniref:Transcription factor BIM2-like isoform X1 n=1 Tax=Phoenix dactylifera TaxID=42345 RepID=A0A8B7BQ30_PHODC|nr:transcription factor BIM2-like isoform X1 [Phoenix dactylifera]